MPTDLQSLLAPFLVAVPDSSAGVERPFGYEPFAMPVRGLAGVAEREPNAVWLEQLRAADALMAQTQYLDTPIEPDIDLTEFAEDGGALYTQVFAARVVAMPAPGDGVSLGVGIGVDFWGELAKLRCIKAIAAKAGVKLELHVHGLASNMVAADGYSNILRLSTMALAAHLAGAAFVYLPPFSAEDSGLHQAVRQNIQNLIVHEVRLPAGQSAITGSYWFDLLCLRLLAASETVPSLEALEEADNAVAARRTADAAEGRQVWVGQTRFQNELLTIPGPMPAGYHAW